MRINRRARATPMTPMNLDSHVEVLSPKAPPQGKLAPEKRKPRSIEQYTMARMDFPARVYQVCKPAPTNLRRPNPMMRTGKTREAIPNPQYINPFP